MIITLPPGAAQTASQPASYILHERAAQFYGAGVGYLSIKSFFGGQATYTVGRSRHTVSERGYLVLNHGQAYDITVESAAPVESFCIFFAPGFAESVRRSLATPADRLLLDPHGARATDLTFFEQTYPHDDLLSPTLLEMRRRLEARAVDASWLSEQLHELMHLKKPIGGGAAILRMTILLTQRAQRCSAEDRRWRIEDSSYRMRGAMLYPPSSILYPL
jgi:hypothetical protein